MLLSEFIADHPDIDAEAGRALADIANGVVTLDRKGALTLTVGMEKKGQRVLTAVTYGEKPPKPDPEAGIYFVHPEQGLCKHDPWQTSLDDLDPETGEIRPKGTSR